MQELIFARAIFFLQELICFFRERRDARANLCVCVCVRVCVCVCVCRYIIEMQGLIFGGKSTKARQVQVPVHCYHFCVRAHKNKINQKFEKKTMSDAGSLPRTLSPSISTRTSPICVCACVRLC